MDMGLIEGGEEEEDRDHISITRGMDIEHLEHVSVIEYIKVDQSTMGCYVGAQDNIYTALCLCCWIYAFLLSILFTLSGNSRTEFARDRCVPMLFGWQIIWLFSILPARVDYQLVVNCCNTNLDNTKKYYNTTSSSSGSSSSSRYTNSKMFGVQWGLCYRCFSRCILSCLALFQCAFIFIWNIAQHRAFDLLLSDDLPAIEIEIRIYVQCLLLLMSICGFVIVFLLILIISRHVIVYDINSMKPLQNVSDQHPLILSSPVEPGGDYPSLIHPPYHHNNMKRNSSYAKQTKWTDSIVLYHF